MDYVIFANSKLPGFGGKMTRKYFMKNFILFFVGLLFIKETNLFKKIFTPRENTLKEAKFYKILK
jgi:hypothetical protein